MSRPIARRGFTLTDLLICCVMLMIVVGGALPTYITHARESAAKIKCSSNLKQIGLAIKMYANDETRNGNAYPRTRYVDNAPPVIGTSNPRGWNDDNSSVRKGVAHSFQPGKGAPEPNDVTGALFLVLRTQDITPDTFICPSSAQDRWQFDAPSETTQDYTNWTTGSTQRRSIGKALSYSYANPYGNSAAISNGFLFNDSMTAEFALMADINPGAPELMTTLGDANGAAIRKINSPNHDYDGQNVLYADGHVDWATTPFVGVQRDNIYTGRTRSGVSASTAISLISPAGTMVGPVDGMDSVMLPTWDPSTPLPTPSMRSWFSDVPMLIVTLIAIGAIGVIVAVVVIYLLPKKTPPPPSGEAPGPARQ